MKKKVVREAGQRSLLEAAPEVAFEYGEGDDRFIHEGIKPDPKAIHSAAVCPEFGWIEITLPLIEKQIAEKNNQ